MQLDAKSALSNAQPFTLQVQEQLAWSGVFERSSRQSIRDELFSPKEFLALSFVPRMGWKQWWSD